jgi:hypothetical protein
MCTDEQGRLERGRQRSWNMYKGGRYVRMREMSVGRALMRWLFSSLHLVGLYWTETEWGAMESLGAGGMATDRRGRVCTTFTGSSSTREASSGARACAARRSVERRAAMMDGIDPLINRPCPPSFCPFLPLATHPRRRRPPPRPHHVRSRRSRRRLARPCPRPRPS